MLGSFRGVTRDSSESEVDLALFALKQIQQEAANIRFQVYRGRRLVDRCVCLIKPLKAFKKRGMQPARIDQLQQFLNEVRGLLPLLSGDGNPSEILTVAHSRKFTELNNRLVNIVKSSFEQLPNELDEDRMRTENIMDAEHDTIELCREAEKRYGAAAMSASGRQGYGMERTSRHSIGGSDTRDTRKSVRQQQLDLEAEARQLREQKAKFAQEVRRFQEEQRRAREASEEQRSGESSDSNEVPPLPPTTSSSSASSLGGARGIAKALTSAMSHSLLSARTNREGPAALHEENIKLREQLAKCTKEMQRMERTLEHTSKNLSVAQHQLRQLQQGGAVVDASRQHEIEQLEAELKQQIKALKDKHAQLDESIRGYDKRTSELAEKERSLEMKRAQMWDMMKLKVADLEQQKLKAEQALQRCALQLLFAQTHGQQWNRKLNWPQPFQLGQNPTPGIFLWEGVESDVEGHVTGLKLDSNQLQGRLPEAIVYLQHLQDLDLSHNELRGPADLEHWVRMRQLQTLLLSHTRLSGPFPRTLCMVATLRILVMDKTDISGPLPEEISHLQALEVLSLQKCKLSGPLPNGLFNLFHLQRLLLSDNSLNGMLSSDIAKLVNLKGLFLSGNRFSGDIPAAMAQLKLLEVAALSFNRFVGRLPVAILQMSSLERLYLVGNNVQVPDIPDAKCDVYMF